ncbi:MAG: BamA/TamA family outer membrane protein [Bacteroidales bacterium]|nr:BamA/TamA family outer membrane protein [Bacteroidales bacterium]
MKKVFSIFIFLLAGVASYAQSVYVSDIYITGNAITSQSVILRELPFSKGTATDTASFGKMLVEARENLLNTSLFNYVTIKTSPSDSLNQGAEAVNVQIEVEERWYIWPIFEMRFNDRNMTSWMKKMDWKRVTLYTGVKISNMFGLGHRLEIRGMYGWDKGMDVSYEKIALDRKKKKYLSAETYGMFYKNVDYITEKNKLKHLSGEHFLKRSYGASATLTYRPHIRWRATATLGYDFSKVSEEVLAANPDYWGVDSRISRTSRAELFVCRDERDYILYPTQGKYASLSLKLEESNNFKFKYGQIQLDLQFYQRLSERWMTSSSLKISSSLSSRYSYIHTKAIGYQIANVTGYELYVIDGQHYITQNNTLKFLILPQKIVQLGNNPKWRKFNKPHFTIYGKLLCDFGYVFQEHNRKCDNSYPNSFLAGVGAGVDLVTYYDIVINVGYAVNSRGKGSVLFGFRAPIF